MGHPQLENIIYDTQIRPTACLFLYPAGHIFLVPNSLEDMAIFSGNLAKVTTGSLRDDNRREQN